MVVVFIVVFLIDKYKYKMIGRESQLALMHETLSINKSCFVALTGRRRVGKTYLINQVYKQNMCLSVTGIQNADTQIQINNFVQKISEHSIKRIKIKPKNWQDVFLLLKNYLKSLSKNKKQVIFLDELPWINTTKSGFIQLLAHLWNDYLSKEKHFVLVICGSATSWITEKIINDKGGFHNRITHSIQLKPFTLAETKAFLNNKKITLSDSSIVELYLVMGGVPYYLENIKRGESPSKAIERMCFSENGLLKNEYDNLYKALFDYPENHEAIIASLAEAKSGLSREEIIKKSKVATGGPYTRAINELIVSGFIIEETPFGKLKRGSIYRLVDEFSVFYHKFIKKNKKANKGIWQLLATSQQYKIWTGYAFETLCIKHTDEIKKVLGIFNVYTQTWSYRHISQNKTDGFQIDLLIDRKDQAINLCECKFYDAPFEINKSYATQLKIRKSLFKQVTKTRKNIFTTLITNYPLKQNAHSIDSIDVNLTISELMV